MLNPTLIDLRTTKANTAFHSSGLERELGDEAHDDPARRRQERRLQMSFGRLQG